jgi:hypothetical protein
MLEPVGTFRRIEKIVLHRCLNEKKTLFLWKASQKQQDIIIQIKKKKKKKKKKI